MSLRNAHKKIIEALKHECLSFYGDRLVSIVVFGSVARGTATVNSDVDVLIVADPLPDGRMRRVAEFLCVEKKLKTVLDTLKSQGVNTYVSPIFKTPDELSGGTPLMLDMTMESLLLYDENCFFEKKIEDMRDRLKRLGAKRVTRGDQWYWDLKPNYKFGEVFTI
jgi:predicted nucleotidyltransferase